MGQLNRDSVLRPATKKTGLPLLRWSTLEWQAREAPKADVDFPLSASQFDKLFGRGTSTRHEFFEIEVGRPRNSTLKLPPSAPAEVGGFVEKLHNFVTKELTKKNPGGRLDFDFLGRSPSSPRSLMLLALKP